MANLLKVAKIHSIQTLHDQGWSRRRIAAALKVDRETVARYVAPARAPDASKPATGANAPTGSDPPEAANGAPGGVADVNAPIEAEGASVAGEAPPPTVEAEDSRRLAIIDTALDRIGWRSRYTKLDRRRLTRQDVELTFEAFAEYQQALHRGGVKDRGGLFGSIFNKLRKERGYG